MSQSHTRMPASFGQSKDSNDAGMRQGAPDNAHKRDIPRDSPGADQAPLGLVSPRGEAGEHTWEWWRCRKCRRKLGKYATDDNGYSRIEVACKCGHINTLRMGVYEPDVSEQG